MLKKLAALALAGVVVLGPTAALLAIGLLVNPAVTALGAGCIQLTSPASTTSGQTSKLSTQQLANAQTIVGVGRRLRVPEYGWVVALATAMQESQLQNLNYGDRDSLGLFQQRANWGTVAERTDPVTSSQFFYTGGSPADGLSENGLLDIPGWEQMSVAEAAQAVQISAFPSAYAKWEPLARDLVAQLGGEAVPGGGCGYPPPGMQCPPTPWPNLEKGLTPDALIVLTCEHQQFPQIKTFYTIGQRPSGGDGDHANGRAVDEMLPFTNYKSAEAKAFGWQVANWTRATPTGSA